MARHPAVAVGVHPHDHLGQAPGARPRGKFAGGEDAVAIAVDAVEIFRARGYELAAMDDTVIVCVGPFDDVRRGGGRRGDGAGALVAGVAAAVHSAPQSTPNVALIDRRGDIRLLTDLNGDILDGVELGDIEEIWYPSFDGEQIQGWIIYPPDFDPNETYPMVLNIHGGPHAMYGVDFNYRFQEWAANGYVVLYTNPRGSTGYTPEFANAIDNAYPGPVDYGDLMAGVDAVLERGFVDESRMYVTGCSGGGVLTAWIVTQTDRFAAAASLCPVTNWISFTGQADISAWAFERFRPHYWEDPQLWLDHSPIMHAHQVTTPTLLMTGVKDLRTPLAQAEEFYANLRRRGVPTMLIAMNDEYHGTTSKPSNMMRTQLYLRQWFETHGEPESEEDASNDN